MRASVGESEEKENQRGKKKERESVGRLRQKHGAYFKAKQKKKLLVVCQFLLNWQPESSYCLLSCLILTFGGKSGNA